MLKNAQVPRSAHKCAKKSYFYARFLWSSLPCVLMDLNYFSDNRHSSAAYNDVRKKYVRLAVSSLSSSYAFVDHEYFTVNCTLYFYMNWHFGQFIIRYMMCDYDVTSMTSNSVLFNYIVSNNLLSNIKNYLWRICYYFCLFQSDPDFKIICFYYVLMWWNI